MKKIDIKNDFSFRVKKFNEIFSRFILKILHAQFTVEDFQLRREKISV